LTIVGDTHVMELPDGREFAWLELGDPQGPPVFGLHGTPGSRRQIVIDEKPVRAAGVRLICPDRPGYGLSTYKPRRTLREFASDIVALADHLGIDRFSVVGISGGGPHAAVCAALLPDRVHAVGLASGVGPLAEPGAEEGMLGFNRVMTRVARRIPWVVLPFYALSTAVTRRWPERAMRAFRRQLPEPDAEVLKRPEVFAAFADDLRHASRTAARAAVQDFALFARNWGFRLEDIRIPVHLWQGDQDRNVPPDHARLQAERIPGAVLHECPGEGHMLVLDHVEEILRLVTSAQPGSGSSTGATNVASHR
jgi:pimeloyl-ACP methyl ester carboxylesterase